MDQCRARKFPQLEKHTRSKPSIKPRGFGAHLLVGCAPTSEGFKSVESRDGPRAEFLAKLPTLPR